jgi:hypothetical protein
VFRIRLLCSARVLLRRLFFGLQAKKPVLKSHLKASCQLCIATPANWLASRFSLLASCRTPLHMPRLFVLIAFALAASGVETEELTEQVESSVAALLQREYDVLKEHFLLRNTELPKGANAFMRELAGQLILRTVLACCTQRSKGQGDYQRLLRSCNPRIQPRCHQSSAAGAWRFSGHDLRRLQDATRRHCEDPTVLRKGGAIPITQR